MYQLLALDLDGTVLKSDRTISPLLIDKIQQLSKTIPVVIVTGRHHTAARPYYLQLGLDTPAICCNGTYLYDYKNDRVLSHNAIPKDKARAFLQRVNEQGMSAVMYVKDGMVHSRHRPVEYISTLEAWAATYPESIRPNIRKVDDLETEIGKTEQVWKFVVEGESLDNFLSLPLISTEFKGEQSWVDRIDFSLKGNTKGAALATYINELGLTAAQVVAVGDHHNDISMLEMAGMGVAMLNADDAIKQIANKVTSGTNDDDSSLANLINELFADHVLVNGGESC